MVTVLSKLPIYLEKYEVHTLTDTIKQEYRYISIKITSTGRSAMETQRIDNYGPVFTGEGFIGI